MYPTVFDLFINNCMNSLMLQNNIILFHKHFLFLVVKLLPRVIYGCILKTFQSTVLPKQRLN